MQLVGHHHFILTLSFSTTFGDISLFVHCSLTTWLCCFMRVSCMFHACFMYVSCVFHVCFMYVSCVFHACFMHVIHLSLCCYVLDSLRGLFAQPAPGVLPAVAAPLPLFVFGWGPFLELLWAVPPCCLSEQPFLGSDRTSWYLPLLQSVSAFYFYEGSSSVSSP